MGLYGKEGKKRNLFASPQAKGRKHSLSAKREFSRSFGQVDHIYPSFFLDRLWRLNWGCDWVKRILVLLWTSKKKCLDRTFRSPVTAARSKRVAKPQHIRGLCMMVLVFGLNVGLGGFYDDDLLLDLSLAEPSLTNIMTFTLLLFLHRITRWRPLRIGLG